MASYRLKYLSGTVFTAVGIVVLVTAAAASTDIEPNLKKTVFDNCKKLLGEERETLLSCYKDLTSRQRRQLCDLDTSNCQALILLLEDGLSATNLSEGSDSSQ